MGARLAWNGWGDILYRDDDMPLSKPVCKDQLQLCWGAREGGVPPRRFPASPATKSQASVLLWVLLSLLWVLLWVLLSPALGREVGRLLGEVTSHPIYVPYLLGVGFPGHIPFLLTFK